MFTERSSSRIKYQFICLLLVYTLLLVFVAPFKGQRVAASAFPASSPIAGTPRAQNNGDADKRRGRRREGELLVRFRQGVGERDKNRVIGEKQGRRAGQLRGRSRLEKIVLEQGQNLETVAGELRSLPEVELVEPNYLIEKAGIIPDDTRFADQWHLRDASGSSDIRAVDAWDTTTGSPKTVVALVDSGIDFTHPDLSDNQWTKKSETPNKRDDDQNGLVDDRHGWDWIVGDGGGRDEQGHGTALAGIIAAQGNNGEGVSGVMWSASLMSLRVLDSAGIGSIEHAVEAIDYAVENGAQVINCSWGTPEESTILREAIQRANERGVVVVASAGNESIDLDNTPYYPAAYSLPNLISVASTNNGDDLASASNWGATKVTIAAPGTNILTTKRGGDYEAVHGTSAAAAVVSGLVGLIRTLRPRLNADATRQALTQSSRQVAALAGKVAAGGIVQAVTTVNMVNSIPAGESESDNNNDGRHEGGRDPENSNGDNGGRPPVQTPAPGRGVGGSFMTDVPQGTIHQSPGFAEMQRTPGYKPRAAPLIRANSAPLPDCGADCGGYTPGPSGNDPDFARERLQRRNETGQPGVDLGSRNFNWSTGLVSLPGRAGMDLNLAIYYNSLVWTKSYNNVQFNRDKGYPTAGFNFSMPSLQNGYFDGERWVRLLITPSGGRTEFRQATADNFLVFDATDGSHARLVFAGDSQSATVTTASGTQMYLTSVSGAGHFHCHWIKDRNGNLITITYNNLGRPSTMTDTLGRVIEFKYTTQGYLDRIIQMRGGAEYVWARFYYDVKTIQTYFQYPITSYGMANGTQIPVLTQIVRADGSSSKFDYNSYGQVYKISQLAADSSVLSYSEYEFNTHLAQTDCPRFTQRRDWVRDWNLNASGVAEPVVTNFSVDPNGGWTEMITPDGTKHKELFETADSWKKGLTTGTETWVGAEKKRWTTLLWEQDDETLPYAKNPRVKESNTYDSDKGVTRRKRTTTLYTSAAQFSLPHVIREYDTDGATVLKKTEIHHRFEPGFIEKRIIGLPGVVKSFQGESTLVSHVEYHHDWPTHYNTGLAPSVQFSATTTDWRGNLVGVRRRDVSDVNNDAKTLWTQLFIYDMAGSVIKTAAHDWKYPTEIEYADSYSDGANRGTRALPTKVTDAAGNYSTSQYDFNTGQLTRATDPKGVVQQLTYDAAGRPVRSATLNADGTEYNYVRWVYPASMGFREQFGTVQQGAGEAYTAELYDGAGRVRIAGGNLPYSAGGWWRQHINYDRMGRQIKQTNLTETGNDTAPSGDDAQGGWVWTEQQYDWKGRPTKNINADGSFSEIEYEGCGCAGGDVTAVRDERGRRKRYTKDVLGRLVKTEELDWSANVYSTAVYEYNGRNQLTKITHNGQERTFTYDGHGRLISKYTPEQGATTLTYTGNDQVWTTTDARGVKATVDYEVRGLLKSVAYTNLPADVEGANASFQYDQVGNRTSMTDVNGQTTYTYNRLSLLESETRAFAGLGGSYTLTYGYNLGGELTSMTDSFGGQTNVTYSYDTLGRMLGIGGASTYAQNTRYRAFGAMKETAYGNGRQFSAKYDRRMRLAEWSVAGVLGWQYDYDKFGERTGRVTYARNLFDQTGQRDASADRSYDYDHVGRLVVSHTGKEARMHTGEPYTAADAYGSYSQAYNYDASGNMTYRVGWGGSYANYVNQTLSYSNNQLSVNPDTGLLMDYDDAGNLISEGVKTYRYDATGQMTHSLQSGLVMGYDGDRLRVKKTAGTATTYYVRSSALGGQVVAELNNTGAWTKGYIYQGGQLVATRQSGSVLWVHQDPVTKSQRLTDTNGAPTGTIVDLDPWGGETTRSYNANQYARKFTSYERDSDDGDEAQQRRYLGNWRRFSQPDPYDGSVSLADPQSLNRYAYTQNDPVNFVDPSGLLAEAPTGPQCREFDSRGACIVRGNVPDPFVITVSDPFTLTGGAALLALWNPGNVSGGGTVTEGEGQRLNPIPPTGRTPPPDSPQLPPPSGLCDAKLSALFGGVAASVFEPPGVNGGGREYLHHLANNGTIHVYTNGQGTPATVGLYTPANGTFRSASGTYEEVNDDGTPRGTFTNQVKYSYPGGLIITFFHVGTVPRGANIPRTNAAGSTRIGTIGGPGGTGTNYNHTHIQFDINKVRTDPRTIYCQS